MKKYSSGSFIDAAVRIYGSAADTISSFPASIIANGGNITPWTIYGNTVEVVSVGEKTENYFDMSLLTNDSTLDISTGLPYTFPNRVATLSPIDVSGLTNVTLSYTSSENNTLFIYSLLNDDTLIIRTAGLQSGSTIDVSSGNKLYISFYSQPDNITVDKLSNVMLNKGDTAKQFEPYGFKLPVVIGSNTINIYMADVLRMSSGADPVYDIMSSTGIITRNVDTDGTPLVIPTTESFTAPTLAIVAGSQSVNFDTTVKPSKAELTYTGWHTHSDKKRSGGAWV